MNAHTIPNLLLYLFFGLTTVVTIIKFVLNKEWKTLTPKRLLWGWKALLFSVVPLVALIIAGKLGNLGVVSAAPYFAGAAFVAYILSQVGLSGELRALVLLIASVALTLALPHAATTAADGTTTAANWIDPVLGAIAGLLVWKSMENLLHKPESRLDDVNAPIVWLGTYYFSKQCMGETGSVSCQEIVLATLTVAVFLRWVQPLIVPNDHIYLKRLILAITGGLALLILLTKVILNTDAMNLALLGGAGFLVTYLLQSLDRHVDDGPILARGMKNILLVGICTLAATRLFGMQGILILAATTVIAPLPGSALIAGLFWVSRALLQGYVIQYDPNVTGINLMHAYTSAAQYAGFLFIIVASLLIKDIKDRRLLGALFLAAVVIVPCASNYFLHSEPTGSLLVALGVTSVLMAMLSPALYPGRGADQENLMLIPTLGCVVALMSQELLELGNNSTTEQRITALCAIAFVMLCIALVNHFVLADRDTKPVQAANS